MAAETVNEELLEEWDWDTGEPTGRSIPRSESYRRGVPHEGVHLWIVRDVSGRAEILFQHRSVNKALYPDVLDITVAGHVPFGLEENKIQKEAMEEIGIAPDDSELIDLGYLRFEERIEALHHREFQHVYIMKSSLELDEYSFNDGEVTGLYSVPADYIKSLSAGDACFSVSGFNGKELVQRTVSRGDFHPLLFADKMRVYMGIIISGAEELVSHGTVSVRMPGI